MVEPGRSQMTIWRMQLAYWITKATDTYSECVIFIAFPWQQWYTNTPQCYVYAYIAFLVYILLY